MISLNKEIFNKLSEIKELGIVKSVNYSYPETFSNLPCITFYEVNNSTVEFSDDDEYLSEINYVVDVWANDYEQLNSVSIKVNENMKEIGFIRELSYDVPNENIKHKFMRFKIVK